MCMCSCDPHLKLLSLAVIIYHQKSEEAKSEQHADPAPNATCTQQEQVFTSRCLLRCQETAFPTSLLSPSSTVGVQKSQILEIKIL